MKKTNALRILDQHKVLYQLVEYIYDPNDLNVEKIAEENGLDIKTVYKTLVAKGDKTGLMVAVIPGDQQLDYKALAKASGNKKVVLIPVKDIQQHTGYIRGACSPIGMKKSYPVFIDEAVKSLETVYVNAGHRGLLMGLNSADLIEITNAQVSNICG